MRCKWGLQAGSMHCSGSILPCGVLAVKCIHCCRPFTIPVTSIAQVGGIAHEDVWIANVYMCGKTVLLLNSNHSCWWCVYFMASYKLKSPLWGPLWHFSNINNLCTQQFKTSSCLFVLYWLSSAWFGGYHTFLAFQMLSTNLFVLSTIPYQNAYQTHII